MAWSLGGQTVAGSLERAGFDVTSTSVAMVETARPRLKPFDAVLVQSAWNCLPWEEFRRLQADNPPALRRRALARRRVSALNLRRAGRVVALTEYMARIASDFSGRTVEVAPVTVPLDLLERFSRPATPAAPSRGVVVPGNFSHYKRPLDALAWAHEQGHVSVAFLGLDDGSGCRELVEQRAHELAIDCTFSVLARDEFFMALRSAEAVVLPSALESLGFALSEALWAGARVVASPIPAHVEVAARLGRAPVWLGAAPGAVQDVSATSYDAATVVAEWRQLGAMLGLERLPRA